MRRSVGVIVLLNLLFGISVVVAQRRPAPQYAGTGNDWLKASNEARLFVVREYLAGYYDGAWGTCNYFGLAITPDNTPLTPENLMQYRCEKYIRSFTKDVDFYRSRLDAFYVMYPQDRGIPIGFILRRMHDGVNPSLEDIHKLGIMDLRSSQGL